MGIWFREYALEEINAMSVGNLGEHLGIEFTEIDESSITGRMPVESRVHQPFGVLHGGASVALAEHLGSIAGNLCVDQERQACVGQEINANHLRPVRTGFVTGIATPIHIGGRSQVWEIRISNEQGQLVCISRLTLAVVAHRSSQRASSPSP